MEISKPLVISELFGAEGVIYPLDYKEREYSFNRINIDGVKLNQVVVKEFEDESGIEFHIMESTDIVAQFEELKYIEEDKKLIYELKFDDCVINVENQKMLGSLVITGISVSYPNDGNGNKILIKTGNNSKIILKDYFKFENILL
ncbi:MAG: hypothetical protein ABRQ27_03840 [Clostridiaceae bacterium]